MERKSAAALRGTTALHMRIQRADGTVEHRSSFNRPRPWWNIRGWIWLAARRREYRQMEKADG